MHPQPPEPATTGGDHELARAQQLTVARRRAVISAFLGPGPTADVSPGALGHGRALADFFEWEVSSGRVADEGGSPWWRATNGLLVEDLETAWHNARSLAADNREAREVALSGGGGGDPAGEWTCFLFGGSSPTEVFWRAHRCSLDRATELATPLLDHETDAERSFITVVMAMVDLAAEELTPTDTPHLAQLTARHYPMEYPITEAEVAALIRRMRAESP